MAEMTANEMVALAKDAAKKRHAEAARSIGGRLQVWDSGTTVINVNQPPFQVAAWTVMWTDLTTENTADEGVLVRALLASAISEMGEGPGVAAYLGGIRSWHNTTTKARESLLDFLLAPATTEGC